MNLILDKKNSILKICNIMFPQNQKNQIVSIYYVHVKSCSYVVL